MRKRIDASSEISLLYPAAKDRSTSAPHWGKNAVEDLEIEQIAWTLSIQNDYHDAIKSILLEMGGNADAITYRQEVLGDFIDSCEVAEGLKNLLPLLSRLRDYAETRDERTPMQETVARLSELNTYVKCIQVLQEVLGNSLAAYHSRGLARLCTWVKSVKEDEVFQSLENELPGMLTKLSGFPSVSIGVNLDSQLRPVEATLLAIHEKPFRGGKLLDKLMSRTSSQKPDRGIGPLHEVPNLHVEGLDPRLVRIPTRMDPLMVPLFRDLYEMLRWLIAPINTALQKYSRVNIGQLISLDTEIAFYLGAAALIGRMQAAGLPMCRPQVLPVDERACQAKNMYNLLLALQAVGEVGEKSLDDTIVLNDVDFGPQGRIFILTGPNQGGKTVFTQAVGVLQVLFQAGLCVPARQAALSPVDGIFTHFARLEKADSGMGRLGDEARRLNEIFESATDQSLVLLNETLASTSPGESLYLARDVVCALRLFGVRAIFATHLHELAEDVEKINAEVPGDSRVVSLVAGVALDGNETETIDEIVPRTYQIKPGPPRGLSYARGIASRYGISYEQLSSRWKEKQQPEK
jgi:DNA mismatch repair protein MutS